MESVHVELEEVGGCVLGWGPQSTGTSMDTRQCLPCSVQDAPPSCLMAVALSTLSVSEQQKHSGRIQYQPVELLHSPLLAAPRTRWMTQLSLFLPCVAVGLGAVTVTR